MSEIVVGVDGASASAAALAWAVDQARATGERVRAVHAYTLPPVGRDGELPPAAAEIHARALRLLDEAVAPVAAERGDVQVVSEARAVRGDRVGRALVDAARSASLLVVGSRGLGSLAGMLAGSVSAECLAAARCPVVVVRARPVRTEAA